MSDDLRFDRLLQEEANALAPAADEVNPWRESMVLVLWGIGLTSITLNFLYLDVILPALGAVLMVLGFRTLRGENRPLRWCWRLSMAAAAVRSIAAVAAALPQDTGSAAGYAVMGLTLALYICLWRGMVGVSRAAGAEKATAPAAGALAVFYVVLFVLAHIGLEGWLAVLPLLIVYVMILRSLVRLSRSLADMGYVIHAAPVRLPAAAVLWGYLGMTLAAVVLAMLLGQRYPMNWQVRADAPQDAAIRAELLELGFPEKVLNDLTAEETAKMSGAMEIRTQTDMEYDKTRYRELNTDIWYDTAMPDNWQYDHAEKQQDGSYRYVYRIYDVRTCVMTHVAVLLEGECIILHHAAIVKPPKESYTEAMELWPVWYGDPDEWSRGGWYQGRVLCDKDGRSYAAGFSALTEGSYESTGFFGSSRRSAITAEWSRLHGSENIRAYILYDARSLTPKWGYLDSWCNCARQTRPVYPFRDALTLWHSWITNDSIDLWQTALQVWSDEIA